MTEVYAPPTSEPPARRLGRSARVLFFWGGYLAVLVSASLLKGAVPAAWAQLVWGAASAAGLLALTWAFVRWEGQRMRAVGTAVGPGSAARFGVGALLGIGLYALTIGLVSALAGPPGFTPVGGDVLGRVLLAVATFGALSAMEELGFRGYPLRTLVEAWGPGWGQAAVSVAFALVHVAYGWAWSPVVLGVLPHAVLFGVAAFVSRGLALPIGLHAGINLARWAVGEKETVGLWTITVTEGGRMPVGAVVTVVAVVVPLLAAAALWRWYPPHNAHPAGTAVP